MERAKAKVKDVISEEEVKEKQEGRRRPKKVIKEEAVPLPKRMSGRPKKETSNGIAVKEEMEKVVIEEEKEIKPRKKNKGREKANGVAFMTELKGKRPSKEETAPLPKRMRGRPKKEATNEVIPLVVKEEVEEVTVKEKEKTKPEKKSKETKREKSEKKGVERAVVKKGLAAVDGVCPIANSSRVYCDSNDIWDCMLNQTNIQFNNNKYYIIQLLKDDQKEAFSVWMRWGRVGATGQNCLKPCGGDLEQAQNLFKKKFSDKTRNNWESRNNFLKVPGKYDLLKMDYSCALDDVETEEEEKKAEERLAKKKVKSHLEARVKALVELICDVKAMEKAVVEMKYDAKKAPLGKLTTEQVKAGYATLKVIESIILASKKPSNQDLLHACNAFYTRIPHSFGMKVPPMIRTKADIQEKLALLQALSDIQAAMIVISQPRDEDLHPVDQHYQGLDCDIDAIDKEDPEFQLVHKYLMTTHGKTHTLYKIKLLEVFRVTRAIEGDRFRDVGNRMLLWHGSRLTNWAGILSQGLRIAPPESPSTGYMFGKGIYFADMASKSANYCMPSCQNKTGLLVLCDVALGKCNELLNAEYQAHKILKGCHSVKGLGRVAPQLETFITSSDGVTIPMGPAVDMKVENKGGYTLQYNEYIVYDVAQVKIKYLLKVHFQFN